MPRSRSRSKSRSKSRSRTKSRSRSVKRDRNPSKSRSRSRSRSLSRSRSPIYKRRSPSRSRSRSRSRSLSRRVSRSRSKSPMSNRKRHVGDRDAPPTSKCLGVFGLSLYTSERDIKGLFEKYGPVESCKIVCDRGTGRSRGFCFINMESVRDAEDAKESLNGYEFDGSHIRVDFSITKRAHTPTPGKYMGRPDQSRSRRLNNVSYRNGGYNGGGYGGSRYGYRRSRSRSRSRSPYYRDRY